MTFVRSLSHRQAVVLLSGGVDSATVCLWLIRDGWVVYPLFVDYGQRAREAEWQAAKVIATSMGGTRIRKLRLGHLGAFYPFELLHSGTKKETLEEYVPQRNLLLGTLGAMYAEAIGARAIAFGIWGDGRDQYPDTTKVFIRKLGSVLRQSANIRVLAPFAGLTKFKVVLYGLRNGLDYGLTWSCNSRSDVHCGRCNSCRERFFLLEEFPEIRPTKYLKAVDP